MSSSLKCVQTLIFHHCAVLRKAGCNFPVDKRTLVSWCLPEKYSDYYLLKRFKENPDLLDQDDKESLFRMPRSRRAYLEAWYEKKLKFSALYAEFFSESVLEKISATPASSDSLGWSNFVNSWFKTFKNDESIYRAMVLFAKFYHTESNELLEQTNSCLGQAAGMLSLDATSDWGRIVHRALTDLISKLQAL